MSTENYEYPEGREAGDFENEPYLHGQAEDRTSPDINPINPWADNVPSGRPVRVDLPSRKGAYVLVRKPEIDEYARSGLLAEQDAMSNHVDQKLLRSGNPALRRKAEEAAQEKMMRDGPALARMIMALDRLLPIICVQPRVLCHFRDVSGVGTPDGLDTTERIPESERERDPEIAYTDQIPIEDKMEILHWIGGQKEAEPFREESSGPVADLADGPRVPVSPKRARKSSGKRR